MTRGHQKEQAQQKNAAKQAAMKKSGTQKGAAEKALTFSCPICKASMNSHKCAAGCEMPCSGPAARGARRLIAGRATAAHGLRKRGRGGRRGASAGGTGRGERERARVGWE